ncbi:MAG: hypothetical protein IT200_16770 [Thermoleophilia bacterium]|nr:hypothetical protein [Thermoleophilia bacterium]
MATPKNARRTSAGRLYEWRAPDLPMDQEPERFWSVTTIIKGGLPSPALTAWGMRAVAEFAVANVQQLSAMVREGMRIVRDEDGAVSALVSDPDAVAGAIDWLKGSPYRERDRKADAGTAIHEHAEAYALGRPMPEPAPGIADQVAAFHRFLEAFRPSPVKHPDGGFWLAEASVYNRVEAYAGTLDAIMDLPGLGRVLVDYKSAKGVYAETAMQLAAYRFAEFIGLPDGTEWPMPAVDGCAVLHLHPNAGPDGYALIPMIADEQVFTAFRYAREVFRWAEETSKGVVGKPLPAPRTEEVAA